MAETIILTTHWDFKYWEEGKPAKFSNTGIDLNQRIPNWRKLKEQCPIPGIGLYVDRHYDKFFDFLLIKDIRLDTADNTVYFDYDFVSKGLRQSVQLDGRINNTNKKFFYAVDTSRVTDALTYLGISSPEKWSSALENTIVQIDWKTFIGQYFVDLQTKLLGNEEFENRVAVLLTALGFKVLQKGHLLVGTVPDGVATYGGDIGLVYDCKNSANYIPNADDMRALESYYNDERTKHRDRQMFPCFIAKKGNTPMVSDKLVISVEPLLYLLFKKIQSGSDFKLDPIKNFFTNKRAITVDNIKTYWD